MCSDYGPSLGSGCADTPPSFFDDMGSDFCDLSSTGTKDSPFKRVCDRLTLHVEAGPFSRIGVDDLPTSQSDDGLQCTKEIPPGICGEATMATPPPSAGGREAPLGSRGARRLDRKRPRLDPLGPEPAAACLERSAIPGDVRGSFAAVAGGVHPRRNWARRLGRVETPTSVTCHVRHSWLIRRLLSDSYAAQSTSSLFSGVSAAPPAKKNFAECLKADGCIKSSGERRNVPAERVDAGRVESAEDRPNAAVDEWLESSTVDVGGGSGGSGSGRLLWPTSMEDSSAWAWPAEEGCLADSAANLVLVPRTANAVRAEPVASCVEPLAEELLLACPAQFLVSLPEDGA
jgi:hypothetical protein